MSVQDDATRNTPAKLAAEFSRILNKGPKADKGCVALTRAARALVEADYDDPDLFRRGMKHIQMEPVWGGREDVAAELRAVCGMGLANTHDPHALRDLVDLLTDREWIARAGAARAIAAVGSEAAALLLRLKILLGDRETEVLSDCMLGLIDVEGGRAFPLIESVADSAGEELREAALLALGASRRADAIEILKARYEGTADSAAKKCILLALSSSRTEQALDYLCGLIREGSKATADAAISSMSLHRDDPRVQDQIAKALSSRS